MDNEVVAGTIRDMDTVGPPSPRREEDRDHVVIIPNVTWSLYESLLRARGDRRRPKYAYLDGVLEVMTTSIWHELDKKLFARLLEAFAEERDVELIGAGETTFRKEAEEAGLEPDECYFVDRIKDAPDIAFEVVHTSGGIEKLEIYRRLRVGEVWFWIDGHFWLYALVDARYEEIRASRILPAFDFEQVTRILLTRDDDAQTSTVRTYRRALRR